MVNRRLIKDTSYIFILHIHSRKFDEGDDTSKTTGYPRIVRFYIHPKSTTPPKKKKEKSVNVKKV